MRNDRMLPRLGAAPSAGSRWTFLVWAPKAKRVEVHVSSPSVIIEPLQPMESGYFYGEVDGLEAGARYKYRLDGVLELPDPASRSQPEGVHGPSELTLPEFAWTDNEWRGLPLEQYVAYELHIGTFTPEGTFDAAITLLDSLARFGVTAVELMPVAQFPGSRNWGYDGVYPYAVQSSYGGPAGLKRFVDAAHRKGLAVILDVVYNHFGPEGNYLNQYGHYLTDRYVTPWGTAVNFDGEDSAAVRRFVVENALQWTTEFHIDALRFDAIHAIFDASRLHILSEITSAIHHHAAGRAVFAIAESNLNDIRIVESVEDGGYGFDAQWNDDFHHALHALLTGERSGYYQDYGELRHLAKAYAEGFVYSGEFSKYRGKRYGTSSKDIPAPRFMVFSQNHDQIGNRMLGERLNHLIVREELKLGAGAVILSPFLPMLFMGQEYAEPAPFLYFVSHSDPDLIEAVRRGRREEFSAFAWQGEPPDPQAEITFQRSKLNHELLHNSQHHAIYEFYRELLRLRKSVPALANLTKDECEVQCFEDADVISIRRWHSRQEALTILHFGGAEAGIELPMRRGIWRKQLDSASPRWLGPGSTLPDQIHSNGSAVWRLPAKSVFLLVSTE